MVVVEMVFAGNGGLDQLVDQVAAGLEEVLYRHAISWDRLYPITLRESFRLGLQQQIVGSHACPPVFGRRRDYRVWLQLPDGGLRAWTALLSCRILAGCREEDAPEGSALRQDLQRCLVDRLGPCLERPERPQMVAGSAV
jgi:hypothetical protein